MAPKIANTSRNAPVDFAIDLRTTWSILVKGRWAILAAIVAVVAGVSVWTYRQPKVYRASASIVIETNAPAVLSQVQEVTDQANLGYWISKEFLETQFQVIRSREVAARAVEKLGLDTDPAFLGTGAASEAPAEPGAGSAVTAPRRGDPVGKVASMIKLSPVRDSKVVVLSIEHTDPALATRLANGVAQAYIEHNLETKMAVSRDAGVWLAEQLRSLTTAVDKSEQAVYEFKHKRNLLSVSLEDQLNMNSSTLKALASTLNALEIERHQLQARRKVIAEARDRADGHEVLAQVLADREPLLQSLRQTEAKLADELAQLRSKYLEKNPKLQTIEAQMADVRARIGQQIDDALEALDVQIEQIVANEKSVRASLEREKKAAIELNKLAIDYNKLKRESEKNLNLHGLVLHRLKETDLTSMLRANNVRLLDPALVPKTPVRPRVQFNIGLSLLFGLGLGVGLAYLVHFLDRTVKSQADIEAVVGLPFLGMIPSIKDVEKTAAKASAEELPRLLRERDMYIITHPRSPVAECHRALRTNITFMSPDKPLARLLVTSAGPREGKSTTAVGIAVTMAQSGKRILIMDTDMRRPRLHHAFGVPNDRGVSTYVVGECPIEDAIKHTDVPGVDVMPCGPIPPNPAELLHTERFRELLDHLTRRYDRVILDSPPVIAVTDATVLSTITDGVLMVVKAGHTTKDMLAQAKRRLADVNANVLGVVLNDLDIEKRQYGYDYYRYYHRYGYYYRDEKESAKASA